MEPFFKGLLASAPSPLNNVGRELLGPRALDFFLASHRGVQAQHCLGGGCVPETRYLKKEVPFCTSMKVLVFVKIEKNHGAGAC